MHKAINSKYKMFKKQLNWANERGVGQFHVFGYTNAIVGGERIYGYCTTWHSYGTAINVAKENTEDGEVFNSSGKLVWNKERGEIYPGVSL